MLRRIENSTTNVVTVSDVKAFLRLSTASTEEDALLQSFINAAEDYCENYCKRALMRQRWELRLDHFPGTDGEIELPRPPLSTVSTDVVVNYVEDTTVGNTTAVPSTGYEVDYYSEPGQIYPSFDNEWPDAVREQRNAVRITYYSGSTASTSVPETIRHWIKLRVGSMYEHRESVMQMGFNNQIGELPRSYVDGLLDQYTVVTMVS